MENISNRILEHYIKIKRKKKNSYSSFSFTNAENNFFYDMHSNFFFFLLTAYIY